MLFSNPGLDRENDSLQPGCAGRLPNRACFARRPGRRLGVKIVASPVIGAALFQTVELVIGLINGAGAVEKGCSPWASSFHRVLSPRILRP